MHLSSRLNSEARGYGPMDDMELISACSKSIEGFKLIDELSKTKPSNEDEEADRIYDSIRPLFSYAINAAAQTIAGCAAKARLFLVLENDDLHDTIIRDIIALDKV